MMEKILKYTGKDRGKDEIPKQGLYMKKIVYFPSFHNFLYKKMGLLRETRGEVAPADC
jgi:hypothetical protein